MSDSLGFASVAQVRLRGGFELLGPIVRLQVQSSSLKCGERPHRWYDPEPIQSVNRMRIEHGGVVGFGGDSSDELADVHHRDHPATKFRSENGLSVGFTSHYQLIRDTYGAHMTDGISGENILIACDRIIEPDMVQHGLVVAAESGLVSVDEVQPAPPCAEFSKFALQYRHDQPADKTVSDTIKFLHQGIRGYYATLRESDPATLISVGDLVYRRESS